MLHRTLLVLALVTACSREDHPPAPTQTRPQLASGTAEDLARELAAANGRGTWAEVKQRWQGQTLRWSVTRQASLCRSADACFVAAFPVQRPAKVGWLPQLQFAPGQYAVLEAACGDRPQCELTFEGQLERLEVSAELPTSMRFSNVRIAAR